MKPWAAHFSATRPASAAEVEGAPVHLLPEAPHVAWVLAEEELAEPASGVVGPGRLDRRLHHLGGGVDLADADEALVGDDAHDEGVLRAVRDVPGRLVPAEDDGFDVGDPHVVSLRAFAT